MHLTLNPYSLLAHVNISKPSTVLAKLTLANEDTGANGALSLSIALVCIVMLDDLQGFPEALSRKETVQRCKRLFFLLIFFLPVKPLESHHKKL